MTKSNTTNSTMEKQIYYRTNDNAESPMVWETKEAALEYISDCLEGITPGYPIEISVVEMTSDEYNQLREL